MRPDPGLPGEERWDFLLHQIAAQPAATQGARAVAVPGRAASATLVLVHAPILRTRLDPPFAKEILDRLVESAKFREHLRNCSRTPSEEIDPKPDRLLVSRARSHKGFPTEK